MKMSKIFLVLAMLFAFVTINADTTIVNTAGLTILPNDVIVIPLFDGVADTLEDSNSVVFGPYRLVGDRNQKQYKGFSFFSGTLTGTTPYIAHQLSLSSDTADIEDNNWVLDDTLETAGATGYIDLSSTAAKFIYFKLYNYGATTNVLGFVNIGMKKNE